MPKTKVSKRRKAKRVLFFNDLHCGHLVGITPPGFGVTVPDKATDPYRFKAYQVGKAIYEWAEAKVAEVRKEKPVDIAVSVGDAIDGQGTMSGGTELLTSDRLVQCKMAKSVIMLAKAPNILLTYGTAYHTGKQEDFEDVLHDQLVATKGVESVKLGSHEWLKVNGRVFDIKHHAGSSSVPHGRNTPLAKEKLWNLIWADRGEQPNADILVRAHTHYHVFCGDKKYLSISLPTLQGMGSKYGARRCSGTVDIGFTVFDIEPDGTYTWEAHCVDLPQHKAKTIEF